MNIIDQRILIPVSPEVVWTHISDISQNPTWQVDCRSISFLSSRRTGEGVRWRYTTDSGKECVVETTAWYEGLGYEYTFVDGVPYRSSRGRIRLQEIPEGTVVQWTLNYETAGILGGVRNAVGLKRHIDNVMVESLKTLWRYINQLSKPERSIRESRSLMRDAPDYEARSHYKPRHPSLIKVEQTGEPASPAAIAEPPISDEDTRPRITAVADAVSAGEPESQVDLSMFKPPREPAASVAEPVEPRVPDIGKAAEIPLPTPESADTAAQIEASLLDTAQISVFDVFGLPKPSETQEMKAITSEAPAEAVTTQSASISAEARTVELPYESRGRVGQRVMSRRRLVKVRRP